MPLNVVPECDNLKQPFQENPWGYRKRLNFVADCIRRRFPSCPPGRIRILDVGCGNGSQLAIPLARQGYDVLGIDPDQESILRARSLAGSGPEFRCCGAGDLPAVKFEIIIVSEVLEHLHEPEALLRSALLHLSDGGLMIVTTPNGWGEFELDSWLYRSLRLDRIINRFRRNQDNSLPSSENHDGHVQFFTLSRLSRMFAAHGLSAFDRRPSTLVCGPLASYAFNRLPKRALEWNARVTDHLPMSVASGWYFALRSDSDSPPTTS